MSTSTDIKELEWIQRAAFGDHEAFRNLVLFYESQLLAYLFHLLGDWENARDVAQETFVAAFYALPRWKPRKQSEDSANEQSSEQNKVQAHLLAPWLYRIATNRALTLLKKQVAHPSLSLIERGEQIQDEQDATLVNQRESSMTLEDHYVTHEMLYEALSHLSKDDATCLVLRFVLGERYSEIAAQLGFTKEAVRKRISRGLIALRSAYKALDMEELL